MEETRSGAESFFEASDDRLRQALDAMPHKVWMVKPDGPALFYNRAMRAFAGAALDLPDRPAREKALIHPDDLGRVAVGREAALADPRDGPSRRASNVRTAAGGGIG